MRKLYYILLIIQTINLNGQWHADSFNVVASWDWESQNLGTFTWSEGKAYFPYYETLHKLTENSAVVELSDGSDGDGGTSKALQVYFDAFTHGLIYPEHGIKLFTYIDAAHTQYDELYFTYDIMYRPGTQFASSGKMPSMIVGEDWGDADDPHSLPRRDEGARLGVRWSGSGMTDEAPWVRDLSPELRTYFYIHNFAKDPYDFDHDGYYGVEEGTILGAGIFKNPEDTKQNYEINAIPQKWINVTQRIVCNSVNPFPDPGDSNGIFEAYINGKLAYVNDTLIVRDTISNGVKIMRLYFDWGGAGDRFKTIQDEWVAIDNIRLWTYADIVTSVKKGRNANTWGHELNLPSSWSNATEISGIVDNKDIHSPSIPENIQVIGLTENTISIKWNAALDNVNVTGYRIFVNDELIEATASTNYELTGLSPDTEYTIKITAIDAAGNESNQSDPVKVTTKYQDNEPPTIPQEITVIGLTESSIGITWIESLDNVSVSGYNIFLNGEKKGTSINNYYLISGLTPRTQYEISVSAFDIEGNESAQSNAIKVTTEEPDELAPTAPTGLSAVNVSERSISLIWNASSDNVSVAGYHIMANGLRRGTSSSNSFQMTQLNPGIEYKISVSAYDAAGSESPPSNQIIINTINPDITVRPTMPEIELVDINKNSNSVDAVSEVKSFGYIELQDYGILIAEESDDILNGSVFYGLPDNTSIINDKRVLDRLEVMYDFSENEGSLIHNITNKTSGNIDLHIERELNSIWQKGQGLKVLANTIISSDKSVKDLIDILKQTGEISVETWVKSSNVNQAGPASIVSFSKDDNERIFTLGQNGNLSYFDYVLGFNTLFNETDGTTEIVTSENFVHPGLHHIIFTRDRNGREKLYINGLENYSGISEGDLFSMDSGYKLVLANEITGEKPWLGTYYLLAIYSKALSYQEVNQNYKAGFGTLKFTSALSDLEPNVQYSISPFVRTDQGIVYGEAESIRIENIRIHEELQDKDTLLLAVFPNPSPGIFTVEFEDTGKSASSAIIHIADQSGQIMYVREFPLPSGTYTGQETFDLTGILKSKGFYSVIVIMGSKYSASKLIIT